MANTFNRIVTNGYNIGKLNVSIGRPMPQPIRTTIGPTLSYPINRRVSIFGGGGINVNRETSIGGGLKIHF